MQIVPYKLLYVIFSCFQYNRIYAGRNQKAAHLKTPLTAIYMGEMRFEKQRRRNLNDRFSGAE